MPQWVPLAVARHGGLTWSRFADYRFAAHCRQVELALAEVGVAGLALPLGFVEGQGRWRLVALLGRGRRDNLYLDAAGQWRGRYVPAGLRTHPFRIDPDEPETLLVDDSSPLLSDSPTGLPLFDDRGELSSRLREVRAFLQRLQHGRQQASKVAAALAGNGLLKPWKAPFDGESAVWQVDEAAWNRLPGRTLLRLRRLGALPVVYAQLMAKANVLTWSQVADAPAESPAPHAPFLIEPEPEYVWPSLDSDDDHEAPMPEEKPPS